VNAGANGGRSRLSTHRAPNEEFPASPKRRQNFVSEETWEWNMDAEAACQEIIERGGGV
jgi:hypothetical protein